MWLWGVEGWLLWWSSGHQWIIFISLSWFGWMWGVEGGGDTLVITWISPKLFLGFEYLLTTGWGVDGVFLGWLLWWSTGHQWEDWLGSCGHQGFQQLNWSMVSEGITGWFKTQNLSMIRHFQRYNTYLRQLTHKGSLKCRTWRKHSIVDNFFSHFT